MGCAAGVRVLSRFGLASPKLEEVDRAGSAIVAFGALGLSAAGSLRNDAVDYGRVAGGTIEVIELEYAFAALRQSVARHLLAGDREALVDARTLIARIERDAGDRLTEREQP